MRWDIFCRVIDNFGDIGVCWRLSQDLAARGQSVRLWVDDSTALAWMAPLGAPGVEVRPWPDSPVQASPGEVVIEAFGCEPPAWFVETMAAMRGRPPLWLNLEYLSAEAYAERCHLLCSPVMSGPAKGLSKLFFYPGFSAGTGGLLREPDLRLRRQRFQREPWLHALGAPDVDAHTLVVSLFCYEPAALAPLMTRLAAHASPVLLLVTDGRAAAALRALRQPGTAHSVGAIPGQDRLQILHLPKLTQPDFDHLLWASDLNFVRGEDSLARALWSEKPFVWQLYPQDDGAHALKLEAFMDCMQATAAVRQWHAIWNGLSGAPLPLLQDLLEAGQFRQFTERLGPQRDLVTQLLELVSEKTAKIQGFAEKSDPTLTSSQPTP